MSKRKIILINLLLFLCIIPVFSSTFFSGYAGGKLNYSSDTSKTYYSPDLTLKGFFAGQLKFSENVWSHLEFSIDTQNLISSSLFHKTDSIFEIDELSLIYRSITTTSSTYFSAFMGYYDPVGSDIFLQRYFGLPEISSKITENWLGIGGSILYPHFGIGGSGVKVFFDSPVALGAYAYLNHEDKDYYVMNGDLRFACAFRFFTVDLAAGVGAPLSDKYKENNVYVAIEKIYWHAGTTVLIGNNYTNSIFLQAGVYNASFQADSDNMIIKPEEMYLLLEFRLRGRNNHVDLSVFSLPQKTVDDLLMIEDTLGANLNLYSSFIGLGNRDITIGTHLTYSFPDMNFMNFQNPMDFLTAESNLNLTPYISASFLSGQIHFQCTMRFFKLINNPWYNCLSCDLGYRTTF